MFPTETQGPAETQVCSRMYRRRKSERTQSGHHQERRTSEWVFRHAYLIPSGPPSLLPLFISLLPPPPPPPPRISQGSPQRQYHVAWDPRGSERSENSTTSARFMAGGRGAVYRVALKEHETIINYSIYSGTSDKGCSE